MPRPSSWGLTGSIRNLARPVAATAPRLVPAEGIQDRVLGTSVVEWLNYHHFLHLIPLGSRWESLTSCPDWSSAGGSSPHSRSPSVSKLSAARTDRIVCWRSLRCTTWTWFWRKLQ